MARAAWRPSRIAQTTSDWPRRMSPAAKTLSLRGPVVAVVGRRRCRAGRSRRPTAPAGPPAPSPRSRSRGRRDRPCRMNSRPGIGWRFSSTRAHFTPVTRPFLPSSPRVAAWNSRSAPFGLARRGAHLGRPVRPDRQLVLALGRASGGCRAASPTARPGGTTVPTQSDAVSPPPITTTCLPEARIGVVGDRPRCPRAGSTGRGTASRNGRRPGPGPGRCGLRGSSAPPANSTASNSLCSDVEGAWSTPTFDAVMERDALGLHLLHAPVDVVLLHLEVGDAVAQQAAGLRLALEDMHVVPDAGELLGGRRGRPGRSRRRRRACRS